MPIDQIRTDRVACLLTDQEVAERLKVHVQTLRNWRFTGKGGLPYIKVGRSIRYLDEDVDSFIASRRIKPGKEAA